MKKICVGFMTAALWVCCAAPALADGVIFPSETIFLSKSSLVAGVPVLIHASLVNTNDSLFSGMVVFKDGTKELGRVSVRLPAGDAQVATISWQPSVGDHTITTELTDSAGTVLSASTQGSQAAAVFSAMPAADTSADNTSQNSLSSAQQNLPTLSSFVPAVDTSSTTIQSSLPIQQFLDGMVPSASSTAQTVLSSIDSGRKSLVDVVDGQIALAKHNVQNVGTSKASHAKSSSTASTTSDAMGTAMNWSLAAMWYAY
ncbi:MAG TPA: hypothetical protein VF803_00860, partial [Candidatus Paceibacterota bacterium]